MAKCKTQTCLSQFKVIHNVIIVLVSLGKFCRLQLAVMFILFFILTCQMHDYYADLRHFNPFMGTGNYSATSNNRKLVHWPLMGGLLHLVQQGGPGWALAPPSPLLDVPSVTAHPSTASVLSSYYSMWHYNYLCP